MGARIKLPPPLDSLLRSELEKVIYESALSREDTLIATRYIVEKEAQIDIAIELGYDRSAISHRLPYILETMKRTATKLFT